MLNLFHSSSEFTKQVSTGITGHFGHEVLSPFIYRVEVDLSVELGDSGQSLPMPSLDGLLSSATQ